MKVLLNANLIESPLPFEAENRAFQYGDGLFETMKHNGLVVPLLSFHLARLKKGMQLLDLQASPSAYNFLEDGIALLRQLNYPESTGCIAKLMVWRRASDRPGYYSTTQACESLLTVRPAPPLLQQAIHLGMSQHARVSASPWSSAKTLNSLPYVMAARECTASVFDDLLLRSVNEEIAEGISSNLFAYIDGRWVTPALSSGCVEGVMRNYLLHERSDIEVRTVTSAELHGAKAMVLSAATGCKVVHTFIDRTLDTGVAEQFISESTASLALFPS